jgi:hypothetical protein
MKRRASGDSIPGSASSLLPTRYSRSNYHYFRSYDKCGDPRCLSRIQIFFSSWIQDVTTTKKRRREIVVLLFCSIKFHIKKIYGFKRYGKKFYPVEKD